MHEATVERKNFFLMGRRVERTGKREQQAP